MTHQHITSKHADADDPMLKPGAGVCGGCGLYPIQAGESHACDGEYRDDE